MAANEPNICNWFKEYRQVIKTHGIVSPEQIWSGVIRQGFRTYPRKKDFLGRLKNLCTAKHQLTKMRQVQY